METHRVILIAITLIASTFWLKLPAARAQSNSIAAAIKPYTGTITSCGCTITKSGFYRLGSDLNSSHGLTAAGGCIDIKASRVLLHSGQPGHQRNLGYNLIGNAFAGVGIHIFPGSNGDFLELPSILTGWNVGLLVEGNNSIVEDFGAGPFHGAGNFIGVEINGGKNNNLNDFVAQNNQHYGLWLHAASQQSA